MSISKGFGKLSWHGIWTWQRIKIEGLHARTLSSRMTLLARSGLQSHPQLDIFAKFAASFTVIPDFKDKTRYAPYVSFRGQISHIATNKG